MKKPVHAAGFPASREPPLFHDQDECHRKHNNPLHTLPSPSTFYPVYLPLLYPVSLALYPISPSLYRVFPVQVSIAAGLPPDVAAVSAVVGPLRIAVAIVVAWPPLEILAGIVAVWLPLEIAVLPWVSVGPLSALALIAFAVSSLRRPRSAASPNDWSFSSRSSSVPLAGEGSACSSMAFLPSDDPCSRSSNLAVRFDKRSGLFGSSPSLSHSAASDTTALPTDATTNHRRKRFHHVRRGQRRHTSRGSRPSLEEQQTR